MPRPDPRRPVPPATAAAVLLAAGVAAAAPAFAQDPYGPDPYGPDPYGPAVLHSNREAFRIPFAASPADLAAAGATEARLLVSTDGGRGWAEAGRAAPGAGGFRYAAPAEGDYWFSLLTVDAAGNPAPANVAITPQLHVRVDRTAPAVALSAAPADDGTVAVNWDVTDAAADPNTLAVTFTPDDGTPGGGPPQPVTVAAGLSGAFHIPADRAAGRVTVSVRDAAGNTGTASRALGGSRLGGDEHVTAQSAPPVRTAAAFAPDGPALPGPPTVAAVRQGFPTPAPMPNPVASGTSAPRLTPPPLAPSPLTPADGLGEDAAAAAVPLRERSFKVGYAVDAVGSSGVGRVDLYITPDGGGRWYSYGEDADRVSPADVTVPGDGEYGFCVRVRSGAGLSEPPPKSGEAPDVRVTVDGTPPAVDLLSAGQGRGADAGRLTVAWRVTEDRPAAAPVRVELGRSAAGPWSVVQDWTADAGAARLPIPPGAGGRIYVRVTARDAAGNQRSAVTPNGVPVDLARPTARVLGVVR